MAAAMMRRRLVFDIWAIALPKLFDVRVLTSTKTISFPSTAIMSISPSAT